MTDNKSPKEVINKMIGGTWVAQAKYVASVGTLVEIYIIEGVVSRTR